MIDLVISIFLWVKMSVINCRVSVTVLLKNYCLQIELVLRTHVGADWSVKIMVLRFCIEVLLHYLTICGLINMLKTALWRASFRDPRTIGVYLSYF